MTTGDLNNWTFILAAYAEGFIVIAGYAAWAWREWRRLRSMLGALRGVEDGMNQ